MTDTAKVKNVSGEDLADGWGGGRLVLAGQAVEVPVDDVYAYTQQSETWAAYNNAAKRAHKAGVEAREAAEAAEVSHLEDRFGPAPEPPAPDDEPAPDAAILGDPSAPFQVDPPGDAAPQTPAGDTPQED